MVSSKRRELIERGLIEKSKKGEPKKLAREDIDLNKIHVMLMDTLPSPSPPAPVVVGTSSRRKDKSTASTINATPLVHNDEILNQHNISSSSTRKGRGRGRGRGRERGRRGCSQNDANVDHFQDPSTFNDVVDLNKGNTHPGSLTQHNQHGDQPGSSSAPLRSGKATQLKQHVESSVYAAESSKNDSISKKNKSIEPLDRMNDLSKARERVPKFFDRTPLINLDDYEIKEGDDDEDDDDARGDDDEDDDDDDEG
ncbi:hypothetical protein H5410_002216 [Solanum commersonii]|uniref:Uncharacterized protein n=1 Tax=Solanum commersonii TaxID=4109 RepID=A0A9J6B1Q6_SOLCO|nr:hypothetical protein H5410_002216 [Solanum commersonii]